MPRMSLPRGSSRYLPGLKAFPAEDGPSLGGTERHGGFPSALGANRGSFHAARRASAVPAAAPGLAGAASFGFVPEIFFVIELLFSRGENEIRSAVDAL